MAALLGQIGGRQIDGDAAGGQREAGSDQRGAHPLLGFRYRLVGQADDVEGGQTGRHLHLHVDGTGLDALEGDRCDTLDHEGLPTPIRVRVAEFCQSYKNICRTKRLRLRFFKKRRGGVP